MELVDETNALQENAYGRLHRWLQQQFTAISPEVSDLPLLLRRCLQALRSRQALFKVALPPMTRRGKRDGGAEVRLVAQKQREEAGVGGVGRMAGAAEVWTDWGRREGPPGVKTGRAR